jgi:CRISPR/Cas system-associated exonuclease Cas4 (RecB family)
MDHFSITQLQTYLLCPQSYRFAYIERKEWEFYPAEMLFGSIIHSVVANLFHNQGELTEEEMVKMFESSWDKEVESTENIRFRSLSPDELKERGSKLIRLFHGKFRHLEPEDVELFFEIPLLDLQTGSFGENVVQGRIDLTSGGSLYEIKTSSRRLRQEEVDRSLQLTFYAWAYFYLYGKPARSLKLINLIKTKEPKIQVLETKREMEDFTRLYRLMVGVISAIKKGVFYPNPLYTYGCDNCPFRSACRG